MSGSPFVPRVRLPNAPDLNVSRLALGSWQTYERMPFERAVLLVRTAVDLGINLFDVGYYGDAHPLDRDARATFGSHTEVYFGRIVEAAGVTRAQYLLSSKLWLEYWPRQRLIEQLDRSLFRLGTSYCDIAMLGAPTADVTDVRHVVAEMADVMNTGRTRHWGVNNWSAADVETASCFASEHGLPGPVLVQLKYSIIRRSLVESEPYRQVMSDTGVALQASDVLEGGLLAGNLAPTRAIGKDPGAIRAQVADTAAALAEIADDVDATPAQLAIAFCLANRATATVLFGASRMGQLLDNVGALAVSQRLTPEVHDRLAAHCLDVGHVSPELA
jgi:L-glyceraldehyde 3-phosphate reductase